MPEHEYLYLLGTLRRAPGFARHWPACEEPMRAIIGHLLAYGADDDDIMLALLVDFPDLPSEAHYNNVLQTEKMRRARAPELAAMARKQGRFLDIPRFQEIDEPDAYELQVVTSAEDLVRLCGTYDLAIRLDSETGELVLSRKVLVDGPLWTVMKRCKPELVRRLSMATPAGSVEP